MEIKSSKSSGATFLQCISGSESPLQVVGRGVINESGEGMFEVCLINPLLPLQPVPTFPRLKYCL